jgi:predicted outer membrane repeat protein
MYQGSGVLTMIDTSFIQNTAASGTAVSADSGGLYLGGQSALLLNCEFVGNIVQGGWSSGFPPTGSGGGMYVTNNALLAINCSFRANQVSGNNNAESGYGGGAYDTRNSVYVNCEFTGNSATFSGGGVYASSFSGSTPTLINCTITRNVSQTFTAGGVGSGSPSNQPALLNCIVFDNEGVEIDSSAVVNHSCVEGGYPGPGNIDADPLFVDAAHGDFHLQDASPCRDAGNRLLLPADAQDLDGDANTTETLSRDLDLVRRIVNGQVDMGAYEWQRTCLTDISRSSPGMAGDGFTNIGDLLAVIAGWGPCDQCNADVNNDDVVNITDLLAVIAGWGACP